MTDKRFTFSNSFQSTFEQQIGQTDKDRKGSRSKEKGKFQLNPKVGSEIEGLPVEILRKKSKNKLQSLRQKSKDKEKWSILNERVQGSRQSITDKKFGPKKYNLSMDSLKKKSDDKQEGEEIHELPDEVVRPSTLSKHSPIHESRAAIFQTPLLPCFASQFYSPPEDFKTVKESEGVWKIGRIKMKGKNAKIVINNIEFEASLADVQGKAGSVLETNMYQLPNWSGFWVVEPSEKLFAQSTQSQSHEMPIQR